MRYLRVITSNNKGDFTIGQDELNKLLTCIEQKKPAVFREGIVANPSHVISVVIDRERNAEIRDMISTGREYEQPSHFADILKDKMSLQQGKKQLK